MAWCGGFIFYHWIRPHDAHCTVWPKREPQKCKIVQNLKKWKIWFQLGRNLTTAAPAGVDNTLSLTWATIWMILAREWWCQKIIHVIVPKSRYSWQNKIIIMDDPSQIMMVPKIIHVIVPKTGIKYLSCHYGWSKSGKDRTGCCQKPDTE